MNTLRILTYFFISVLTTLFFSCEKNNTPTYTVIYDGNGSISGTVPVDENKYIKGQSATVLANTGSLAKTGFSFSNWNSSADGSGTGYSAGDQLQIASSNVTLYAHWVPTFTVTYDGNGSTGGTVPLDNNNYLQGQKAIVLANTGNLVKSGYYFSNWNSMANGTGATYQPGDNLSISSNNATLYADWTPSASQWTSSTLPSSSNWNSITYGNNTFVTVAQGTAESAYSTDGGNTWKSSTLPGAASWVSIAFGANTFVAINGSTVSATSSDGFTWTQHSITSPGSGAYSKIIYANNQFIVIGPNGSPSLVSSDGITWSSGTLPSSSYWNSIAFGNNTYVVLAGTTGNAATSTDGITWTPQSIGASTHSLAFGNGIFVALNNGNVAFVSSDGVSWTSHTMPFNGVWNITFGNGVFVAFESSTSNVVTSVDGVTWNSYSLPGSVTWTSATYNGSKFIAVATGSTMAAIAN